MDAFNRARWNYVAVGGCKCSCCNKGCGQGCGKANKRKINKKARAMLKRSVRSEALTD